MVNYSDFRKFVKKHYLRLVKNLKEICKFENKKCFVSKIKL